MHMEEANKPPVGEGMPFKRKLAQKSERPFDHPPVHMAFLGDSVTHGVFEVNVLRDNQMQLIMDPDSVYHARLRRKLNMIHPTVPITVTNAGISGDHAPGGLSRLERDILRVSPDLVVVCFGLNDATLGMPGLDRYGDGLAGIYKKLKKAGIETLFMTPNMTNTYVPEPLKDSWLEGIATTCANHQTNGVMDAYMDLAGKISRENGVPVCDVYHKWKRLFADGADVTALLSNYINHPNREMHSLFADALFDMIMFQ